jgi:hypothetical protein
MRESIFTSESSASSAARSLLDVTPFNSKRTWNKALLSNRADPEQSKVLEREKKRIETERRVRGHQSAERGNCVARVFEPGSGGFRLTDWGSVGINRVERDVFLSKRRKLC